MIDIKVTSLTNDRSIKQSISKQKQSIGRYLNQIRSLLHKNIIYHGRRRGTKLHNQPLLSIIKI